MSKNSVLVLAENMKSLRYLNLSNNNGITAIAAQEEGTLFSSLPVIFKHNTLMHLDVSQCESLRQINLEAPNLERLHVNGCQQLTFIKGQFPRLHYMDMRDTPALDSPKLGDFIVSNPRFFKDGHLEIEDDNPNDTLIKDARRFLNGKLVYKPDPHSDVGKIEFPIADLAHPFEGEFDLSGLMYTNWREEVVPIANDFRIKIGYRKVREYEPKTSVWIVPKFMIDQSRSSFKSVPWSSPIGVGWDVG